jgi:hypothetical protein
MMVALCAVNLDGKLSQWDLHLESVTKLTSAIAYAENIALLTERTQCTCPTCWC